MADFDDAERHALHEVEPADQLRWLLQDVDPDLQFSGWLQTQVSPPPGVPQLRCDCVAGLRSAGGTQPPWACLIEAQGQALPDMAVWMSIYLGLLFNVLRYEGRDRYQMMGVILNLSDGELSHTIDWRVPLKQKAELAPAGSETPVAGVSEPAPPASETPAFGVSCRFLIKNVRKESAEHTLDRIDGGELGLCILIWIPLMAGADQTALITRWRGLVMRQQQVHLRAEYIALALVFAEMAGRKDLWQAELKGFNMQESTVIRGWRKEGFDEGTLTNARAAVIAVLQTRFPSVGVPETVRAAVEKCANLHQLTNWHREAILTASPADFERFLAAGGK